MKVRFRPEEGKSRFHHDYSDSSSSFLPEVAISRLEGHDGPISAVRFSKDGKYCLTGSYDRSVRLWNPLRLDPAHPPTSKASSTHAELHDNTADIPMEDLPQSLPIQLYHDGITHPVTAVAVDDASTTIVCASEKTVVVHDVVTGQCKRRLQGHVGRINAVALNPDAQVYLSASYDATVRLWDSRSRSFEPIQIFREAKDSVTAVHAVQESSIEVAIIRTASVDGIVRTYDLRKGMLQCDDVKSPITGMCPVTKDRGGLLVNCLDGALRLIDLEQGSLVQHYADSHQAGQYGLDCAVSATAEHVATGSEDGSAVFYNAKNGRVCQVLEGHRQPTCSVALHPRKDQASVAITASFDGTAVVWGNDAGLMQW